MNALTLYATARVRETYAIHTETHPWYVVSLKEDLHRPTRKNRYTSAVVTFNGGQEYIEASKQKTAIGIQTLIKNNLFHAEGSPISFFFSQASDDTMRRIVRWARKRYEAGAVKIYHVRADDTGYESCRVF